MSFLSDNKVFLGVVGVALSSAAAGYVLYSRHRHGNSIAKLQTKPTKIVAEAAVKYFMEYAIREPPPLRGLREATMKHIDHAMVSSSDEAQLIRFLMQMVDAKKVIEIGVYTGHNTLSMALTLPPDGKVVACDVTDKYLKEVNAQQYFKEGEVESKIDLRIQPALATLDELISSGESGSYDLVFIDAEKSEYDNYYEKALQLLRKGGLIIIDNALFSLRVCDPVMLATHNNTRIIHALNVKIQKDSRVEMCFLPMADGVNIAMKL
ncbi:probable caffeoyl-CoA O-methyltransferase 2 [Montipora foliosa]|uniref:probable caffeoyl-CoA O-methyltransferase 2 n=1 Tax=Montipora foliosa TaxID=591990 RepID=UPI0035F13BA2